MSEVIAYDHLFVDEAGAPNLFNKRRKVIVGTEGTSRYFMLGVVRLTRPEEARDRLAALRAALLADPYFAGVPSMDPARRKTALFFHAKDDPPEVRREVFRLLPTLGVSVRVAIRRKSVLVAEAEELFKRGYRMTSDRIYDDLVKWLFLGLISPLRDAYVLFARRGKSERLDALLRAIVYATKADRFKAPHLITVSAAQPAEHAGLQIADYYLWAVQRLFERREDRFFRLLEGQFEAVMDLDDLRRHPTGEWYDQSNKLELDKIMPETG